MPPRAFLCFLLLLTCACGARHAAELEPPGTSAGLPALGQLPAPTRAISATNGYVQLDENDVVATHSATRNGDDLQLNQSAENAFAVYGVYGFTEDGGPSAVRVTAESVTGTYWVAFSDFTKGQWVFVGPFSSSATIPIPANTTPQTYLNKYGHTFFALLCPPGSSTGIMQAELGLDSGATGPSPVALTALPSADKIYLYWNASASAAQPDFIGYQLERTPAFVDNWSIIYKGRNMNYADDDITATDTFRYRVAARDLAGHLSSYDITSPVALNSGASAVIIPVVSLPDGPLYAPASVTFDMSGSFVSDGTPIESYVVTSGNIKLTGPDPVIQTTLQPGCYKFTFRVNTATSYATTDRLLKVYPQWQPDSVTVLQSSSSISRLQHLRSGYLPDGNKAHIGFDPVYPALVAWTQDDDVFVPHYLPVPFEDPDYIGEPQTYGDSLYVPVILSNHCMVVRFNSQGAWVVDTPYVEATSKFAALTIYPDGRFGLFFCEFWPNITRHLMYRVLGTDNTFGEDLGLVAVPLDALDGVYTAGDDVVDVVYSESGKTNWIRWKVGVGMVDSAVLANKPSPCIDLERDPATGRPCLLETYAASGSDYRARYRELDAAGVWSPEEVLDNSSPNLTVGDLVCNSAGKFAAGGINAGQDIFALYERGGPGWTRRNTASTSYYTSDSISLMVNSAGNAILTGSDLSGGTTSDVLHPDGSQDIGWTLPGGQGFGSQLHATSGSDGLHVLFSASQTNESHHLVSADGSAWSAASTFPFGATNLDISANKAGEVYGSYVYLGSAGLSYWTGSSWTLEDTFACGLAFRPSLLDQWNEEGDIDWLVYDGTTDMLHFATGSQTNPFTSTDASSPAFYEGGCVTPYGFYGFDSDNVSLVPWGSDTAYSVLDCHYDCGDSYLLGRDLASAIGEMGDVAHTTLWLNMDHSGAPARVVAGGQYPDEVTHFPAVTDTSRADYRQTASAAAAFGATAVGLTCDLFGTQPHFEWSDYGHWEQLTLPPGMDHMSRPELLIGQDGRWHIVYLNLEMDQVMVRSSL